MDLTNLLADPVLHLVLHTPTASERLARPISWCAPTELLDPSSYLTTNALVLTTGMGLNVRDPRTWDAYVERLAQVSVAGVVFSTGDAHRTVPHGLIEAAMTYEVPVLELMADVPTLLLLRHVESALSTERFHAAQRTWDLADSCARLAADGADLTALLDHIEASTRGPVALMDAEGSPLFLSRHWSGGAYDVASARRLPLPGELSGQCFLVAPQSLNHDIAGPAAAVIAMHVSQALGGASLPGAAQPLIDVLLSPRGTTRAVDETVEITGLSRAQPTLALCLNLRGHSTEASGSGSQARRMGHFQLWRIRSLLQSTGLVVRQAEHAGVHVLVAQGDQLSDADHVDALFDRICQVAEGQAIGGVMTPVGATPHGLKTSLPAVLTQARSCIGRIVRAGEQTLLDLMILSAPIGARDLASELIDRLRRDDPSGALLTTLQTAVDCAGQRPATAAAMGIHRNTLTARLQRIQVLTGWNLADGQTLTALAVAVRLVRR